MSGIKVADALLTLLQRVELLILHRGPQYASRVATQNGAGDPSTAQRNQQRHNEQQLRLRLRNSPRKPGNA